MLQKPPISPPFFFVEEIDGFVLADGNILRAYAIAFAIPREEIVMRNKVTSPKLFGRYGFLLSETIRSAHIGDHCAKRATGSISWQWKECNECITR